MNKSVAIIDFGTSRITVLIGSRGINDTVNIDGIGICDYDGFVGGEWRDKENLVYAVAQAISVAESSARVKISKLYVGVPGDFLQNEVNDVSISLGKKRRITEADVADLHTRGNLYFNDEESTVIHIQPIYYTLDDERKLIAPVGVVSTRLGGSISYTLADNSFINTVDALAARLGIPETDYVATPLAEVMLLFDDYKRDNTVMLADVGALGTTLTIARGDGLCRVHYFPWGGENITAAIADGLNIPRDEAEKLKGKVSLSLDPAYELPKDEPEENIKPHIMRTEYVLETKTERVTYPVAMTNTIVANEIERFARYVEKTLLDCDYEFPEFLTLSITGGGIVNIRGAMAIVSKYLHREVGEVMPSQPLLNRPQLSSAIGLIDMVLRSDMPYEGIVSRIKRWFSRR